MPTRSQQAVIGLKFQGAVHTRHADGLGKKVGGVGNEHDETALDARVPPDIGVFESESSQDTNHGANGQAAKELGQEVPDAVQQAPHTDAAALATGALRRLEDDDGDSIIEDGLAKDDGVQLGVDLEGIEDGQDGDGVGGGQGGADRDGVDPGHVEALERDGRVQPQQDTNDDG